MIFFIFFSLSYSIYCHFYFSLVLHKGSSLRLYVGSLNTSIDKTIRNAFKKSLLTVQSQDNVSGQKRMKVLTK